jgi:hypothetical protein
MGYPQAAPGSTGYPQVANGPQGYAQAAPGGPAKGRPMPLLFVFMLLVLMLGGGAWAVTGGHVPGRSAPGGAAGETPLAAPGLSANPVGSLVSGGDFCQTARELRAEKSTDLSGEGRNPVAMTRKAQADYSKLAAVAPPELHGDFQIVIDVTEKLAAALQNGQAMNPNSMRAILSPEFRAAAEHITDYMKQQCGIDFDGASVRGADGF